jgi:hypothetical protein
MSPEGGPIAKACTVTDAEEDWHGHIGMMWRIRAEFLHGYKGLQQATWLDPTVPCRVWRALGELRSV